MTILLYFHFGTFRNFKHYYLFFIKGTMKSYFPKAVSYNRFVELESRVFFQLMFFLNLGAFGRCTGITFVDSTMIPVCHNLRRYANKVFKGIATDGKGTMGWCHGFKLHLACNDRGEIIAFVLTGANVSDKDPNVFKVLAKRLYGKLFADKGYISQKLFDFLFEDGIQLVTGLRVNMKNKLMPFYDRMMLRKRYIIETINDMLKNTAQIVHSRHRSVSNFIMNLISALGAYCFFDNKPKALQGYCIEDTKQLSLFYRQNNLFRFFIYCPCLMVWEENSRICLHMQLIAILSRIGVLNDRIHEYMYPYTPWGSLLVMSKLPKFVLERYRIVLNVRYLFLGII